MLGAGPLGLLSLARLRRLGAGPVTVVARHPHQAELAGDLGADEVLPDDHPQLARDLRRRRAALVVEAVGGAAETLATAFAAVDRGGEVVVLGLFDAPRGLDVTDAVLRGVRARFAAAAGVGRRDLRRRARARAARRGAALARLLTHRFPLAEVDEAFATAAAPGARALKVLVRPAVKIYQPFVDHRLGVVYAPRHIRSDRDVAECTVPTDTANRDAAVDVE